MRKAPEPQMTPKRLLHRANLALQKAYAEITALRTALGFYANRRHWVGKDHYSTPNQDFPAWTEASKANKDEGQLARDALGNEPDEKRR